MKTLPQLISYIKESTPSNFTNANGLTHPSMKHYDNNEMADFLKTPQGAKHQFVGRDQQGKPHTSSDVQITNQN